MVQQRKRNPNGAGTITKRKDGRFQCAVYVLQPEDTRARKFAYGKTWAECDAKRRELLDKVDDRYVMMNAGDEILMRFEVPPGPPPGWKRDFVWVSDGWTKDGNLNTKYGKTVLPLPYHGMSNYDAPPGRLEDDPVYKRHAKDWQTYHTRYVTPAGFERGLRAFRREPAKR